MPFTVQFESVQDFLPIAAKTMFKVCPLFVCQCWLKTRPVIIYHATEIQSWCFQLLFWSKLELELDVYRDIKREKVQQK